MSEEQLPQPTSCEKCDEYLAGWKRALADYDNLKKDLIKEKQAARDGAYEDAANKITPVFDLLYEALKYIPNDPEHPSAKVFQGISMTSKYLEEQMRKLGIESYGAQADQPLNARLHESVGMRSEDGKGDQVILEVVQRGWKLGDKVVRPAKVIINNKNE